MLHRKIHQIYQKKEHQKRRDKFYIHKIQTNRGIPTFNPVKNRSHDTIEYNRELIGYVYQKQFNLQEYTVM